MAEAQGAVGPSSEGVRQFFFFIKEEVSSDWKDLAFHLDFRRSDINNIADRNRDDKSRCMDLLEEWLKRKGERATIDVLMEALSEAGLQSTVDGLRGKYEELDSSQAPHRELKSKREDADPCTIQEQVHSEEDNLQKKGSSWTVDNVITCLKDLYATEYAHVRPLPWCEDLNLDLGQVYTNLQLQRRDDKGRFEDTNTIVSFADIYETSAAKAGSISSRSTVRKIRVEGDPGIGKSCSCQKLAHDWSTGQLDKFKVVFFLEMRHLSGKVRDAIFEQLLPRDTKMTPDQVWSYIEENQDDVLFILDGLDELSRRAKTDVVDLIQGKILRKCHVLVTSRPYHCVKDLEKCHEFYKILGFSKKNSVAFLRKYFSKTAESATKLVKQLEINKSLSEIVVNPLNNVLVCVVWEDCREELPADKAELYQMIVHSVVKRFCTKNNIPFDGDEFPSNIVAALRSLGKLSWEGLKQDNLEFKIDSIREEFVADADRILNIGLLTRDYSFSRIKRSCYCAFLHKTFQEYMAAYYISELVTKKKERKEGMKCIRTLFGLVADSPIVGICRGYRQVRRFLLPLLADNPSPLFEMLAGELEESQADGYKCRLSYICIWLLGKTCGSSEVAEIVAPCLCPHLSPSMYMDDSDYNVTLENFLAAYYGGLAQVLSCQKKLSLRQDLRLTQQLTFDCTPIVTGSLSRQQLHMVREALSDCTTIRSVTLLEKLTGTPVSKTRVLFSPIRTFIPPCGIETVSINFKDTTSFLLWELTNLLKDLSVVARLEHVQIEIGSNGSSTDFSEHDRLLGIMIAKQSCLRSLRVKIGEWMCDLSGVTCKELRGFGNLTSSLQNISEHTTLETVEFEYPANDYMLCGTQAREEYDVGAMVHKMTTCVSENKVLKSLQVRWTISHLNSYFARTSYTAICSRESVTDLCQAIQRNRNLKTLTIDGMFSESEGHQEIIDQLMRNKPRNFQELRITMFERSIYEPSPCGSDDTSYEEIPSERDMGVNDQWSERPRSSSI